MRFFQVVSLMWLGVSSVQAAKPSIFPPVGCAQAFEAAQDIFTIMAFDSRRVMEAKNILDTLLTSGENRQGGFSKVSPQAQSAKWHQNEPYETDRPNLGPLVLAQMEETRKMLGEVPETLAAHTEAAKSKKVLPRAIGLTDPGEIDTVVEIISESLRTSKRPLTEKERNTKMIVGGRVMIASAFPFAFGLLAKDFMPGSSELFFSVPGIVGMAAGLIGVLRDASEEISAADLWTLLAAAHSSNYCAAGERQWVSFNQKYDNTRIDTISFGLVCEEDERRLLIETHSKKTDWVPRPVTMH